MKGFIEFIREKGVVGLAVGFILGGAVSKLVTSFVSDAVNPFLSVALGMAGDLQNMYFQVFSIKVMWGSFASNLVNFLVIAFVVYFGVKILKLDKLDKPKA